MQFFLPWLVLGDFNEITFAREKLGGNRRKEYRMRSYKETMNSYNLIDLGFIGSKLTWSNKRRTNPIFERLDRCWACQKWILNNPDVVVNNLSILSSNRKLVL